MKIHQWIFWRRYPLTVAFGGGCFVALAQAPWHIIPLAFVGLGVLLVLLDHCAQNKNPIKQGALVGAAFGFGYCLVGLYWIGLSLVFGPFPWTVGFLAPVVSVGLALVFCVFWAFLCCLSLCFWDFGAGRIVSLAVCWVLMELMLGLVLPWNLLGQIWTSVPIFLQGASVIGVYGLSFLTVLALLATHSWRWCLCVLVCAGILGAWGFMHRGFETRVHSTTVLRLVQPNIPQKEKWLLSLRKKNQNRLLTLSVPSPEVTHLIWPETAIFGGQLENHKTQLLPFWDGLDYRGVAAR